MIEKVEVKEKKEKKMEPHACCKKGEHTYIVTSWIVSAGHKKALHMRCRNCLMPLDLVELSNVEWFKE